MSKDKALSALAKRLYFSKYPEKKMLCNARGSAKKGGLKFNLELSDIVIPEICPVLGIPLFTDVQRGKRLDGRASLDRIDPRKGYVKGNVWVISWKANHLKLNNTLGTLRLLVQALETKEAGR